MWFIFVQASNLVFWNYFFKITLFILSLWIGIEIISIQKWEIQVGFSVFMSSSQNNNELIIIWLDETTKLYDRQKEREIKNFEPRSPWQGLIQDLRNGRRPSARTYSAIFMINYYSWLTSKKTSELHFKSIFGMISFISYQKTDANNESPENESPETPEYFCISMIRGYNSPRFSTWRIPQTAMQHSLCWSFCHKDDLKWSSSYEESIMFIQNLKMTTKW